MQDTANKNRRPLAPLTPSPLAGSNSAYLEDVYEAYLQDPNSVDPSFRAYFDQLPRVNGSSAETPHSPVRAAFRRLARTPGIVQVNAPAAVAGMAPTDKERKQVKVLQLIDAYRVRGHQRANLDPLGLWRRPEAPDLELHFHGLTPYDFDTMFDTGSLVGPRTATLREILDLLKRTYCGTIGAEYMHITDTAEKRWLQSCLESVHGVPNYPADVKRNLLERLTAAEGLERYLAIKYVGVKRFGLEGGESMIPMLDELIQRSGSYGMKEVVIGMAHRGRLNVLVNVMGKKPSDLFAEFDGKAKSSGDGTGDVKYHLGYSSDVKTPGGPLHLALAFNPSHLEIVGPVVQGSVRARQQRMRDKYGARVMPIVIHGDAAFAGQGVVMESFNMSQSRGYTARGTVHIIVNNQIGFTTSVQQDARSTMYASDVAKMVGAPILHVNADDPEAVMFVTQIALDYRMTFRKDVVIDLVCYRRHGHNEADEPAMTQPIMYQHIRQLPTTRELYAKRLIAESVVDADIARGYANAYQRALDAGDCVVPHFIPREEVGYSYYADWLPYVGKDYPAIVDTRISLDTIRELGERLSSLPEGFELHPQVAKLLEARRKMAAGALAIDWGFAEIMAYATLLKDGFPVRISGQDSGRGTFGHRHAVVYNVKDGAGYVPLRGLYEGQPNFIIINSLLSEEAVLAFEYGYATTDPRTLVIWEGQFGDFVNGAQVVIDQFISAGEQKWNRLAGITLFLPHGYEGQGPEHSSGRPERFLQLCAQNNMIVCAPTTPAQMFHMLRRQMHWHCRKPLIVMTPKSLLRYRLSFSTLEDVTQQSFRPVLPDMDPIDPNGVTRLVLCSGKVYYDLVEKRRERKQTDTAIIRVEQLYPFPHEELSAEMRRYPKAKKFIWCQEEPKNQGAWYTTQHRFRRALPPGIELEYVGRPTMAAPAVGSSDLHTKQLQEFLNEALGSP
ncbi:MAG: 2-oxoglutarate dehydrogenase E1 component [Gammaproteobacteria bacterium]|nr:2-oxoglutarate dehydrogenase E1 component [Gammaproteobacteria bacterium]